MYLNSNVLKSSNITVFEYGLLCLIFGNKNEDNSEIIKENCSEDSLKQLQERGLIQFVKPKNKQQTIYHCVRLSKEAQEMLELIETPNILEEDIRIFEWMKQIYLSNEKEIGNAKKCKMWISYFRSYSGISKNCLATLIKEFISDEDNFQWSKRLDYLFWKPANAFSSRFNLSDSKLYNYYEKRKEYFDNIFKELEQ